MRANSPTDNDLNILNTPEQPSALAAIPEGDKKLVKASESKDGKVIIEQIRARHQRNVEELKTMDLIKLGPTMAIASILAHQQMIRDDEALLNRIDLTKESIKAATEKNASQQ